MFIVSGASNTDYKTDRGIYTGKSLLFDDGSSQYLSWTPGTAGNRKQFIISAWVKFHETDITYPTIMHQYTGVSSTCSFYIDSINEFLLFYDVQNGTDYSVVTEGVFRDLHRWYHILLTYDSTISTAADRAIIYVDGIRVAQENTTHGAFPQNHEVLINSAAVHHIGRHQGAGEYSNMSIADYNFIDGLTIQSGNVLLNDFDYISSDTGKWVPKKYTGEYGLNGFHHDYSDTTETDTVFDQDSLITGPISRGTLGANESGLYFDGGNNYLSRVFSTAGDRKTFTITMWFKRAGLGTLQGLFTADAAGASNEGQLMFETDNTLRFSGNGTIYRNSNRIFNDTDKWHHIVAYIDSTQSTADDRIKIYIDGKELTSFSTNVNPSLNLDDASWNNTNDHRVGNDTAIGSRNFYGYISDVYFIDGQALVPSNFGENISGQWRPKVYSGSFGTNGSHLTFDTDDSDTTTVTDNSINTHTWTVQGWSSNIETNGYVTDKPTDNCSVLNLANPGQTNTYSNGNRTCDFAVNNNCSSTIWFDSGKVVCEVLVNNMTTAMDIGILEDTVSQDDGSWPVGTARTYQHDGEKYDGTNTAYGATYTSGDLIRIEVDMDGDTIEFFKNDVSQGDAFTSGITGKRWRFIAWSSSASSQVTFTFNNDDFTDTPTTGFLGLKESNLESVEYALSPNIFDANGYSSNVGGSYTNDTMVDNHATLNPLERHTYNPTYSNGNLTAASVTSSQGHSAMSSLSFDVEDVNGFYTECYWDSGNTSGSNFNSAGIVPKNGDKQGTSGAIRTDDSISYQEDGHVWSSLVDTQTYTAWGTTGDKIMVFVKNGSIWFGRNGTWNGDPDAGTGAAVTGLIDEYMFMSIHFSTTSGMTWNFGATDFTYTIPTGGKTLSSANLPEPTIKKPQEHGNIGLWTGDASADRDLDSLCSFKPDLAWIKQRTQAYNHVLYDNVRGAGTLKAMSTAGADAEGSLADNSTNGYLDEFRTGGLGVTSGSADPSYVNSASDEFWSLLLLADNTSGSSNTDGSTTSTVSANTDAGFSIVTYTGTGANATVGHGLASAPDLIIFKERGAVNDWCVYHSSNTSAPETDYLQINKTNATVDSVLTFNDTAPTASVFTVSTDSLVNGSSKTYVAYCIVFGDVFAGGSYTGNGNADGPFIPTDELLFLMTKESTPGTSSWFMYDQLRNTYNGSNKKTIYAEVSNAEQDTATYTIDFLSNGFKQRNTDTQTNGSGNSYIWFGIKKNGGQLVY